jgi:membrane-associated phospholipid phosphatase
MTMRRCGVLVAAALAVAAPASAQTVQPLQTRGAVETAVLVGSLGTAGLATLISVGPGAPWQRQWLSIDEPVKRNFSPAAARASDVLAGIAVLGPLALQFTGGWNGDSGQRALVYGETLAANLALNGLTKALVGRPRPYTYNADPAAQAQVEANPRDAHLSFFSGHASTTFAAAVAGAYLYSQSTGDVGARTAVWASTLALAGATSNLRVRAGKHFYSDVLAGAVVGTGVGWLVPALHFGGRDPHPLAPAEWVAIATAPLAGALASQLVPLPELPVAQAQLLPWVTGQGAGVMLAGQF